MPDWVVTGLVQIIGVAVVTALIQHRFRPRAIPAPDGSRARSLECWTRVVSGEHPHLARRWRVGRAVVSDGRIELTLYRWGLRLRKQEHFAVDVQAVDRVGVRRAGWRNNLRFTASHRLVTVSTAGGARLEVALPSDEVEVVLDIVEGHPLPEEHEPPGRDRGSDWFLNPRVVVWSRTGARDDDVAQTPGEVVDQLDRCLDDVAAQLSDSGLSLSDLVHLQVRTTDSHAVGSHIGALAGRLRKAGATTSITMLAVDRLTAPGQVVQLEATAIT